MDIKIEIISVYYENPLRICTMNEIAKDISKPYATVYSYLQDFVSKGALHNEKKGRSVLCSINLESEEAINLFSSYSLDYKVNFVSKHKLISKAIEELIGKILEATDHKIYSVVLFGSFVKGTETKKSDIDLLILSPSKESFDEPIERECFTVYRSYGLEINPVIAEPQSYLAMIKDREHNLGKEIIRSKVIFYGPENFWRLTFEGLK